MGWWSWKGVIAGELRYKSVGNRIQSLSFNYQKTFYRTNCLPMGHLSTATNDLGPYLPPFWLPTPNNTPHPMQKSTSLISPDYAYPRLCTRLWEKVKIYRTLSTRTHPKIANIFQCREMPIYPIRHDIVLERDSCVSHLYFNLGLLPPSSAQDCSCSARI